MTLHLADDTCSQGINLFSGPIEPLPHPYLVTVTVADLRFLFLLPKITLVARERVRSQGACRVVVGRPWGEAHLEAQQGAQVPGWHILDLVQHVELGLSHWRVPRGGPCCGQGHWRVPHGGPC